MTAGQPQQDVLRFGIHTGLNLMLGAALLFAALLRETPLFWRNEGGFPVWLREFTLILYWPGVAVMAVGGLLSIRLMVSLFVGTPLLKPACAAVILQWLLWLTVMLLALWDNLNRLISGAPLYQRVPGVD